MRILSIFCRRGLQCLLVGGVVLTAVSAWGQAPAAPPAQPGGMFTAQDSKSALAEKAAARGAMLMQLGKYPDSPGNGSYPATYAMAPNGMEDVVYEPTNLAAVKGKLGVYIWGNGGCGYDATSARFHLIEIASHGYVAIAPGEIISGPKGPATPPASDKRATPEKMIAALDWILAENARAGSPYYGKIDAGAVAFSGHSCGGLIAMTAALDPRAKALVLENSPATLDSHPLATWSNLEAALDALPGTMDPAQDILVLYLTSHGSPDHDLRVDMAPLPLDPIGAQAIRENSGSASVMRGAQRSPGQ